MALTRSDPRQLLEAAGLRAKKSWGQNFLRDRRILETIADATGAAPEVPVVELGAGLGALTVHLLERGGLVVAVERDRELVPVLHRYVEGAFPGLPLARDLQNLIPSAAEGCRDGPAGPRSLAILEADAAQIDYGDLARQLESPPVVCGNLPYQISSRILVAIADQARHVRRAIFMVQKEVADRAQAAPGRDFGLLSVLLQRSMRVGTVCRVPRTAFHPQPRVTSAVVRLEPHGELFDPDTDRRLVAAARAAFASRRKTLKNCLVRALRGDGETVNAAVRAAGLDPGARAETLAVTEFARLGRELAAVGLLE